MSNKSMKFQATEKIIVSSSKLINKLENLELLKSAVPPESPISVDLTNEPRPAYEIFNNLERLILYSDDDTDEFFMPAVDGKSSLKLLHIIIVTKTFCRHLPPRHSVTIGAQLREDNFAWISVDGRVQQHLPTSFKVD
jgi:hypothetical protein